jgi:hypothetical protein
MTPLREAEQAEIAYRRAQGEAEMRRVTRNLAVRKALKRHSLAQVAEATGLGRTRIHQIGEGK